MKALYDSDDIYLFANQSVVILVEYLFDRFRKIRDLVFISNLLHVVVYAVTLRYMEQTHKLENQEQVTDCVGKQSCADDEENPVKYKWIENNSEKIISEGKVILWINTIYTFYQLYVTVLGSYYMIDMARLFELGFVIFNTVFIVFQTIFLYG